MLIIVQACKTPRAGITMLSRSQPQLETIERRVRHALPRNLHWQRVKVLCLLVQGHTRAATVDDMLQLNHMRLKHLPIQLAAPQMDLPNQ